MARKGDVPSMPERGLPRHEVLAAIVARALSRDPAQRYQSAAEMLVALDDYALASGLTASQLRFGRFLSENFAEEIVALRRHREKAAERLSASIAPAPTSYWPPAPSSPEAKPGLRLRPLWLAAAAAALGTLCWMMLR